MKSRVMELLDRGIAAMLSAIELYNKPSFHYRTEGFSILVINAWELLLKAKVLKNNNNKLSSLWVYERRKNKNGEKSKKKYKKLTASKNPFTHNLESLINKLVASGELNQTVKNNLSLLIEYRDSAIHFYNQNSIFQIRLQEIGMACVKNFTSLLKSWFKKDLSEFDLYLMPLAFVKQPSALDVTIFSSEEKAFLKYVEELENTKLSPNSPFSVTVNVDIKFSRSKASDAVAVQISSDPNAMKLSISDDQFAEKYKYSYPELTNICKKRYSDFKVNNGYHKLRKDLEKNPKYGKWRYLDPINKKGLKKPYFSEAILAEFDKHYKRRMEK